MQLQIELISPKGRTELPLNYNHLVQAAIYQRIDDNTFRNFLHQEGFCLEKRKFKLFVFSRLLGKCFFDKLNEKFIFQPPIELWVASPLRKFVQELGSGLAKRGTFKIGYETLEVSKTTFIEPVFKTNKVTVKMLSPIVAYSTLKKDGKPFTYYYSPFEERFSELIKMNLLKKSRILYGVENQEHQEFQISPKMVKKTDFKIVTFKDTVIKGWLGYFNLYGSPFLLYLALHCGLGSKNSEGFGFCKMEEEDVS